MFYQFIPKSMYNWVHQLGKYNIFGFFVSPENVSLTRRGTITGEGFQILTYARHSWSLSSEGSLGIHVLLMWPMVNSEDPWYSHLLRSVEVYRGWDSNIQPSAREANALMYCAPAADWIELDNVLILIGSQVHWFSLTYECENQWKVYQYTRNTNFGLILYINYVIMLILYF